MNLENVKNINKLWKYDKMGGTRGEIDLKNLKLGTDVSNMISKLMLVIWLGGKSLEENIGKVGENWRKFVFHNFFCFTLKKYKWCRYAKFRFIQIPQQMTKFSNEFKFVKLTLPGKTNKFFKEIFLFKICSHSPCPRTCKKMAEIKSTKELFVSLS